jgi:alkanesulfonate monooxygenase SsuD/methylene tetrahydromethanopterin reductase-like flavin-dependent oxidoreductase (luciferase family)
VQFGIFYEHQFPRPWDADGEQQLIADALDQIELADHLGIQYVWEVEHHFLEEYSHSSAPEVFLAAASQRTTTMRLGHGIIQTAPAYNHPARTAERIAMLDLVSGGRVEFGSGESSSEAELRGFGLEPAVKREAWLEGLEVALRCMTENPFTGVEGKFVTMPPRNVVPKPVQKPHPPLWLACSRRDTILLAAEKGMGALSFSFIEPEDAAQWVADYEATIRERCVPVGLAVNPRLACVSPMMCARNEADAIARGLEGANFFGYSLAHFYVFGEHVPGSTNVWEEFQERRDNLGYSPEAAIAERAQTLGAKAAAGDTTGLRGAVGTPDQIRDFLRRYEAAGVDQIIFVMQAGKNRHEHIMESIEIFGREILPEFVERDEARAAAKAEKWAPIMERALARRHQTSPMMPENYVMKAIPKQMVDAIENEEAQRWIDNLADKQATGKMDTEFQRLIDG